MFGLSQGRLKRLVDGDEVKKAIQEAEMECSGEIRVSVSRFFWGSVEKAARKAFVRLGMNRTEQRNGILFFVVPSRKRFVILGDEGIHNKVGQKFWDEVAGAVSLYFKKGEFTEGLVHGVKKAGKRLKLHFPHALDDINELPDDVDYE